MTEQQKNILKQSWRTIIDNVRSEDIMDYLIEVRLSSTVTLKCEPKTVFEIALWSAVFVRFPKII